jgi:NAD+ synthase
MSLVQNSGPLNYVVDGAGPPVILLHGMSASLADWSRLMPQLVSAGYQAIAVDLLGHGDSAKPADPSHYSIQVVYAALEEWIDRLDIHRPFYLIGHSLGGYLSLTYALNHPERVQALVLLNPLYSLKQLTGMLDLMMPLSSVGIGLLKAAPQWLVNSFLSYNDSFLTKVDGETRWAYSRDIKRASPYFLRLPATAPDLTPRLPYITPETLVLWGVGDRIEKADSFPHLVAALPNATGKPIANCGHHPHQTQPELTSRMILDFFTLHPVQIEERMLADDALRIDPGQVAAQIEEFLRRKVDEYQRDGAVVGISGGIDSAVVASLAVRALGADKVKALILPERDSSPDSKSDALVEIDRLGIQHREVDLTPLLSKMGVYGLLPLRILGTRQLKTAIVQHQHRVQAEALGELPFRAGLLGTRDLGDKKQLIDSGNAYTRVKHRLRMVTLYYYADLENRLALGTTNRSEASTGFVVKWGDNVADVEPILPLYKTQVRQLAGFLGVSDKIIDKPPSPDLMPGIVDGLALGVDYETLDQILWGLEQGWSPERMGATMRVSAAQVSHVQEMQRRSEHLRTLPPSPKLKWQASARVNGAPPEVDKLPGRAADRASAPDRTSARYLFGTMPQIFRPERAKGVRTVIQFVLSGQGGGNWYVTIQDGTCRVTEGVSQAAEATIRMDAADYVALVTGRLGGMRAFLSGRVKVSGDASLLKRMQAWFPQYKTE